MVSQPRLEGFLGETTPVRGANHLNNRLTLLGDAFFDVDSPVMMFEELNPLVQDKKMGPTVYCLMNMTNVDK
jgi:hypothetical protein